MNYKKIKVLNKEKTQKLTDLIRMKSPDWMNVESAEKTLQKWDENQVEIEKNLTEILNEEFDLDFQGATHPEYKSLEGRVKSSKYDEWWSSGRLVSTSDAQDAKDLTNDTFAAAQMHATHHWNNKWIEPGHLNIEKWYLSDETHKWVVQPVDFEHRLWGEIGFRKGLVPLGPNAVDYNGEKVAGKFNYEIAQILGESIENINRRFDRGYQTCVMLPSMNKTDKSEYFREKNKSSAKTDLQLAHSTSSNLNDRIKKNTSIKVHNDASNDNTLNSFSKENFTDRKIYALSPYEFGIALWKFIADDYKFGATSKAMLRSYIVDNENYTASKIESLSSPYDDAGEKLFNIFKYGNLTLTIQTMLFLLKIERDLEAQSFFITDWVTFTKSFEEWIYEKGHENEYDASGNVIGKKKTMWYRDFKSIKDSIRYNQFYQEINSDFLKSYVNKSYFKSIGIIITPKKLPRSWTPINKLDNLKFWNNKNIDGETLNEYNNTHAAHLVSDYELSRLTNEERKNAFEEESKVLKSYGFQDITGHENNFRVTCAYHNLRMNVMRMSDYLLILDTTDDKKEQDELITKKLSEYKNKYEDKPIL